jgi:hypothetical protein
MKLIEERLLFAKQIKESVNVRSRLSFGKQRCW